MILWYFSVLTPTVLWFREPVAGIHVNHCDEYGTLNPGAAHLPHLVGVLSLVWVSHQPQFSDFLELFRC